MAAHKQAAGSHQGKGPTIATAKKAVKVKGQKNSSSRSAIKSRTQKLISVT